MPKTDAPPAEAARLGGTVHPPLCEDVRHQCRMSEGHADDGRMPGAYGGLCRASERYTLRGVPLFGMSWPLPPVWVRQPASENGGKMLLLSPPFRGGDAQPDVVLADGAEPLPRF